MMKSAEELKAEVMGSLKRLEAGHPEVALDFLMDHAKNFFDPETFYEPDQALLDCLGRYERWLETRQGENPGQLMEEIVLLSFRCLKGWHSLESYQSYAPQHDLVVSGFRIEWLCLMEYLHLPRSGRTIVVEAKNTQEKVQDHQLSRLGSIVQNKFEETCHLGVFFSRTGATGFDHSGTRRQRFLCDARATQVLLHAKTKKFVVVLDDHDIRQLGQRGSLPGILELKIRDIEKAGGLPLTFEGEFSKRNELPPHLACHMKAHDGD